METLSNIRASEIIGLKVVNANDDDLGKIEDILLDSTGDCVYAVLSFGSVMGIGGKFIALPFSSLALNRADDCAILNVDKEKLEHAPGFDKDHWPSMADSAWAQTVNSYYGVQAHRRDVY